MEENRIVAISGHRPNRIPDEKGTREAINEALALLKPAFLIQGMANGADMWAAAEAWKLGIPYIGARPWATHSAMNPEAYNWVVENAQQIEVLNPSTSYPGPQAYETRNRWMIDRADILLAVWDGTPRGGTFNAIMYARKKEKAIYRINPKTNEAGFYPGS